MCTLKMSESTVNIFTAVSKMQAELTNASKNKTGHNYKYADLAECIETAKEPLANNGLAVIQQMGMTSTGENTLFTTLAHISGEYMQSETIIPKANLSGSAKGNPVQEMGASITYMRRYCFASIIGMTQEDTDGVIQQQANKKTQVKQPTEQEQISKMIDYVSKESGNNDNMLYYFSQALGREITNTNAIKIQDVVVVRAFMDKNPIKSMFGGF